MQVCTSPGWIAGMQHASPVLCSLLLLQKASEQLDFQFHSVCWLLCWHQFLPSALKALAI
jgi:hypothetical protein